MTSLDVSKEHTNNTEINNTEINNTEYNKTDLIYLSEKDDGMDGWDGYTQYREYFLEQLEFDILLAQYPYDTDTLNEILELLIETACSRRKYIRVCGEDKPAEVVKSRLMKLTNEHIRYVMDSLKENTTKVRNIKQYLLSALYNAPVTISSYYSALVNYDLYGGKQE